MENGPKIIMIQGKNPGKTLAVFCGVHGNERVGIDAVNEVLEEVDIKNGTVYFVFANTKAIKQNTRFIEKNLNRCFIEGNNGQTYEDCIARELLPILDKSDTLLDIHASNTKNTTPFVIHGGLDSDFVKELDFEIISTGWDEIEPGATEGYMLHQNKPGVCVECGYTEDSESYTGLAKDSLYKFLKYNGAISVSTERTERKQKHLFVYRVVMKDVEDFELTKNFDDFEELKKGTCFAQDNTKKYIVDRDSVILFAKKGKPVGVEACVLGYWK
ncbi:MAG: succinylglutamate desuccinylase/aspartoacylase family protein [Patescibacteria group bacterium UBA2163]